MALSKLSVTPVALDLPYRPPTGEFFLAQPIPPAVADAQCVFTPPSPLSQPTELFSVQINNGKVPAYRFIHTTYREQMLMFVDGSSLGNGLPTARAGYGVVFAPVQWFFPISSRLEQDGHPQTSNRAELCAVLAALSLRIWIGEGFKKIVIACDSQYVVNGISSGF